MRHNQGQSLACVTSGSPLILQTHLLPILPNQLAQGKIHRAFRYSQGQYSGMGSIFGFPSSSRFSSHSRSTSIPKLGRDTGVYAAAC